MRRHPLLQVLRLLAIAVIFGQTTGGFAADARLPRAVSAIATATTVTIDASHQYQKMDGFGVNANSASWNNGKLTPALDTLVDSGGNAVWRVIVESLQNWETTNDDSDPFHFNWTYYNALYETPKFQALWGTLGHLQQKGVPTILLNVMGCPPAWMGRCGIAGDMEDEFVEMEASLLYYARYTKNLRIDIFSPTNEEDLGNPEGPWVDATQYVRILKKLSARLDGLGLNSIRLLGPETASIDAGTGSYLPTTFAEPALMAKIDHFGLHNYSGSSGGAESVIKGSAYPDRNFWMTEFSTWCSGCDNGAPNPDDWPFAHDTVSFLFDHIEQGAASALVYDAYDSFYEHHGSMGYWGLLAYDASTQTYHARKRFFTFAQVAKFVRPGAIRIAASTSLQSMRLLAFRDPATGQVIITGINDSGSAQTLDGQLNNLSGVDSLQLVQTTPTMDLADGGTVAVAAGRFSVQVAPDSIFTLISTTAAVPTPSSTVSPSTSPTRASGPTPTAGITTTSTATPTPTGDRVNLPLILAGEPTIQPNVDDNPAGIAEAFQFTATASGTLNNLLIYLDPSSTATMAVVGVDSNTRGDSPGGLLTQGRR